MKGVHDNDAMGGPDSRLEIITFFEMLYIPSKCVKGLGQQKNDATCGRIDSPIVIESRRVSYLKRSSIPAKAVFDMARIPMALDNGGQSIRGQDLVNVSFLAGTMDCRKGRSAVPP